MAHAAELNSDNVVIQVLSFDNSLEPNVVEFATELFGGTWIQTSYNHNFRHRFAGIGYLYDPTLDIFMTPKCHDEAVFDGITYEWTCTNSEHDVNLSE